MGRLASRQHEALISYHTYQRIQERLDGIGYTPKRKNLNEDFPLRGFVVCADCGGPLTANWSKGSHARHAYYLCRGRDCASHGKSIRRETIEGEFKTLLRSVQATEKLFKVATSMFRELWNHRLSKSEGQAKALTAQLVKLERQVSQFLDRIVEASVPSVIGAYEARVRKLEEEKLLLREQLASTQRPASSFESTLRTALEFLSNPWKLQNSDRLEDRRAVLKLVVADRLEYARNEGFRTANLSMPFNVLNKICGLESGMAHSRGFEPPTCAFGGLGFNYIRYYQALNCFPDGM